MMQKEFEERTGMQVTAAEYAKIEKAYMAAGNMDKDTFCKEYKKLHDNPLMKEIVLDITISSNLNKKQADEIKRLKEERRALREFLLQQAQNTQSKEIREKAIDLLGTKEYMIYMIKYGYDLWQDDREILVETLNNIQE